MYEVLFCIFHPILLFQVSNSLFPWLLVLHSYQGRGKVLQIFGGGRDRRGRDRVVIQGILMKTDLFSLLPKSGGDSFVWRLCIHTYFKASFYASKNGLVIYLAKLLPQSKRHHQFQNPTWHFALVYAFFASHSIKSEKTTFQGKTYWKKSETWPRTT